MHGICLFILIYLMVVHLTCMPKVVQFCSEGTMLVSSLIALQISGEKKTRSFFGVRPRDYTSPNGK